MQQILAQPKLHGLAPVIAPGHIRVRLAPSPTGMLHVGTARTALFNFLFAKKYGGAFILRMEDTDKERSDPRFERDIVENLRWLGIAWDEGVEAGGSFGPYRQSERSSIYEHYLMRLLRDNNAYWCFCTEEELARAREEQAARKEVQRYSGRCRALSADEAEKYRSEGKAAVLRFKMTDREIRFTDAIRGEVTFDGALFGDIVIAKSLTVPLYNIAAVIDDAEMRITHVIRGEDHLSNTPKQIALAEAFGLPVPQYAHIPLLLAKDRSKLSKRHGATSVQEFRDTGYFPEAMVNFLALLGWNPGTEQEIFSLAELIQEFSLERVQKSGAVFDREKLDWLNRHYQEHKETRWLTSSEEDPLIAIFGKALAARDIAEARRSNAYLNIVLPLILQRIKGPHELHERLEEFLFFFKQPQYARELLLWKAMTDDEARAALARAHGILQNIPEHEFTIEALEEILLKKAGEIGDRGQLLWPLRVALSGQNTSPGPHEIAAVLGKSETLERIETAKRLFSSTLPLDR